MRKLRNIVKVYFYLSEKETNGFLALCFLIVFVLMIPWAYNFYLEKTWKPDTSFIIREEKAKVGTKTKVKAKKTVTKPFKLAAFNPNGLVPWEKMGLSREIANRIKKYKAKGGSFKVKKDLLKIYGFPESTFKQLQAFILLPDTIFKPVNKQFPITYTEKQQPVNLNKVTPKELAKQVQGIGKVLSERIIKFRKALGGFSKKEQLYEVYGLDSGLVTKALKLVYVDKNFSPKKLLINTANDSVLALHPYISAKEARIIINYRKQHGYLKGIEDVKLSKAFSQQEIEKILPYLTF